jgi:hypothetical protein
MAQLPLHEEKIAVGAEIGRIAKILPNSFIYKRL